MWGVTGCQLDFVLLISTLWDWSLASFPMQLSDAQQNDLAICVLQTIVSRAIWSQAKLLCSPLVCQANLLRKLSEFSGTVKCADHAVTFLSLYFPSTNYFRGARAFLVPSHIMRLFHFLKLNGKKKKKRDNWAKMEIPPRSCWTPSLCSFLPPKISSAAWGKQVLFTASVPCFPFVRLAVSFGKTGKTAWVCERGRGAAFSSLLPLHSLSPGLSIAFVEPGQLLLAESWCWTCWKQELLVTISIFLQSLVFKPFKLTCNLHRAASHTAWKPLTINSLQAVFCSAPGSVALCAGSLCHWSLPMHCSLICYSLAARTCFNSGWLSNVQFSRKTSCILPCVDSAGDYFLQPLRSTEVAQSNWVLEHVLMISCANWCFSWEISGQGRMGMAATLHSDLLSSEKMW